jgi:polyferredoxin
LRVDVLRDRGALLRETAEGRIENAYTLKLMNLAEAPRDFTVEVSGLPGLEIVGERHFASEPGSIRAVPLTVSAPGDGELRGIQPISFHIKARQDPAGELVEPSSFALGR